MITPSGMEDSYASARAKLPTAATGAGERCQPIRPIAIPIVHGQFPLTPRGLPTPRVATYRRALNYRSCGSRLWKFLA
jgi:hypothetical protein